MVALWSEPFVLSTIFQYFDNNGIRTSLKVVLRNRQNVQQVGHEYDVQNNRMNSHVVMQSRNKDYPELCCVEA